MSKCKFELVILLKNSDGLPNGSKKVIESDSAEVIANEWNAYNGLNNKKKKKVIERAKTDVEINYGLKEYQSHLEKFNKKPKLED